MYSGMLHHLPITEERKNQSGQKIHYTCRVKFSSIQNSRQKREQDRGHDNMIFALKFRP
jgi:hypothetical protein